MSDLIHVTDENFEAEVINSQTPVLVDFSAAWCGPCKQLKPIVTELASEFSGRLKVAHVDVEQARQYAMKYGVMSVPTVLYIKNGEVCDSQIGLSTKDKMIDKINSLF